MGNVELDKVKDEGNFYKLLEKICKDFNVKNRKMIIKKFMEKR